MTTLHDRLADLAEDAPPGGHAPELWDRGVRLHRRRRAGAAGLVVAVLVLIGALASFERPHPAPAPAKVPFSTLRIPRTAYPPSPWAKGTDDTGAPGPLAFVSIAERWRAEGVTDHRGGMQPFGVSAIDGSAVFLDLPGIRPDDLCCGGVTLSPDGTKVGYARVRHFNSGKVLGFAVYDALTGTTTMLDDPRNPVVRGGDGSDLTFSGDSRYLETDYSLTGSNQARQHSLVIWNVDTGAQQVAEPAGRYWLPNHGSAPAGIVWSRGQETYTFDPTIRRTTAVRTPFRVVQASYGPDGRAFAAIAFGEKVRDPWRLYVGSSEADLHEVRLPIDTDVLLGWRDPQHVVVRQLPTGEAVAVDLTTRRSTSLRLDVTGHQMMLPSYAADLWANPLVAGERPPHVHDPRLPWWIASGLLAVALGGAWSRRRLRVRG